PGCGHDRAAALRAGVHAPYGGDNGGLRRGGDPATTTASTAAAATARAPRPAAGARAAAASPRAATAAHAAIARGAQLSSAVTAHPGSCAQYASRVVVRCRGLLRHGAARGCDGATVVS